MTSPWQEWKKKNSERQSSGNVRPWDLANPNTVRVAEEVRESRYLMCEKCEHFLKLTKQCMKCGCFMHIKTTMAHAECPVGKWTSVEIS